MYTIFYSCTQQITVQNQLGCMGQGWGWVRGPNLQMMTFLEVSGCVESKSKVATKLVQPVFFFFFGQQSGHMPSGWTFPGTKGSRILPKSLDHPDTTCTAICHAQL
jgi:hypothetical protein